jgi:hypothetical protein
LHRQQSPKRIDTIILNYESSAVSFEIVHYFAAEPFFYPPTH